ncbi:hypothetical protein EBF03_03835 [Arcanobacterium haemolyticum]|uniref:hypothetical protein n=1 Tax=Arcanobacterium haemolyticum TaxID=28264 RepID=UPI001110B2C7|nr:hypothetical protein [Arcanobacterium haemolyticum]QCX46635.1 hypothetical protein EBF03_03835 [Arcanobacterium haemolyticum]
MHIQSGLNTSILGDEECVERHYLTLAMPFGAPLLAVPTAVHDARLMTICQYFKTYTILDLNKKLLCFDIKALGSQLKKIGMLVIQDQVWNKVSQNRGSKATRYY